MSNELPRLLSTEAVAELMHLDERTIQRRAGKGLIPAHKMPGRTGAFLFEREVIEEILERREAS